MGTAVGILIIMMLFSSAILGAASGMQDARPESWVLPVVHVADRDDERFRLLLRDGDLFFVVAEGALGHPGRGIPVEILGASEVRSIVPGSLDARIRMDAPRHGGTSR